MKFYRLEPEVAGGIGPDSVIDRSVSPPRVERLHYVFDGWLGDELLESFACFLVTKRLADEIKRINPSGAQFGHVKITTSLQFEDLHPGKLLPEFLRLKVLGKPGEDDFGISKDNRLIVSERILNLLKSSGLSHCDVVPWTRD